MTCEHVPVPGGGFAIVCGRFPRRQRCNCGAPATLFCDWILREGEQPRSKKSKTCDAPLCANCTLSPAPEKDLCPEHARAFEAWKAAHRVTEIINQLTELSDG